MKSNYDLIVIGAGPAGASAATCAAEHGLSVLVLGEQPSPGGQVYRNIERIGPGTAEILGPDYLAGKGVVEKFRKAKVDYLPGALLWHAEAEPKCMVGYVHHGEAFQVMGRRIILATGARERPMPIPGWTLAGVMAVTAAEVLLKSQSMIPAGPVVLAGSGPLLLLTAGRLISAGAPVKAILDTTPRKNYLDALPCLPKALGAGGYLLQGLAMMRKIRRSNVPVYRNVKNLIALGQEKFESVRFSVGESEHEIPADHLLLHHGVVPDTQLSFLLGCEHEWYEVQRYWRPKLDDWGNTSLKGVGVAGDAAGILGAKAAPLSGRLAALEAAFSLQSISEPQRDRKAGPLRKSLKRETLARPFLDHLFKPSPELLAPKDHDTIVCRCEELTVGQIKKALETEPLDPNKLKAQTRCGMGPCQGRMCGLTVSEIIAEDGKLEVPQVGYFHIRPPINQLTMEQLANLQTAGKTENPHETE